MCVLFELLHTEDYVWCNLLQNKGKKKVRNTHAFTNVLNTI